jgi:hypothetical protein
MKYRDVINKLELRHFSGGAGFDADAFASLKEAYPKRRRNRIIQSVTAAVMLIVCSIFAATISALPFIPCWLLYMALTLVLRTYKWNAQTAKSRKTLGISRRELKTAINQVKDENKYISAGTKVWFFIALLLAFILYVISLLFNFDMLEKSAVTVCIGVVSALIGMFGVFQCLRLKKNYLWPVVISALLPVVYGAALLAFQAAGLYHEQFYNGADIAFFNLTACILTLTTGVYRKKLKKYRIKLKNTQKAKHWFYAAIILSGLVYFFIILIAFANLIDTGLDKEIPVLFVSGLAGLFGVWLLFRKHGYGTLIALVILVVCPGILYLVGSRPDDIWIMSVMLAAPFVLMLSVEWIIRKERQYRIQNIVYKE